MICICHWIYICWPIIIYICFKQIVLRYLIYSKRSTFFYSPCHILRIVCHNLDLHAYSSLFIVVIVNFTFFFVCLLIFVLCYFNWLILSLYYIFAFRQWHPTPVLLPRKSHGWRSLVGCSPWGRKELDTTERLPFHSSLSCIGEGNGNPLQCSCLESPRDGGAWWAAVYGVAQSRTRLKWLSSSSSSGIFPFLYIILSYCSLFCFCCCCCCCCCCLLKDTLIFLLG